ncbi:MAG TPA: SMC-Scp complex subunit ScpB [Myxococcaceae bacterium]|nr:SMC-Scp complex subunit ScpB [Myxococcaceae bacterium]
MSTPEKPDEGADQPTPAVPFSEAEVQSVASPPSDVELEDVEPADIDEQPVEFEPFERLVQRSRRLSPERVRTVVESLLFVTDKPVTLDQLHEATGVDRPRLQAALEQLGGIHRDGVSGIVLTEVAGGWQFRTDPDSGEFVRRFLRVKPHRLTRAALETLAIIAYRQPVTRPEIEDVRGVDSGAVVKALLERRLIKILGKKDEVGRPILYGTTREFLEFFALKDLSALPTLREFHELSEEHRTLVDKEAPAPEGPENLVEELADPSFGQGLEAAAPGAEEAMEALEQAMEEAEARSRAAAASLGTESTSPRPPAGESER